MPGAVPLGLLIIWASFGKKHCFLKLDLLKFEPEIESFVLIWSHKYFLSDRETLKVLAIASVVKSSGVGPRPPVVINRLLLRDISLINLIILSELSPIVDCLKWLSPKVDNSSEIHWAFVFTILPRSNSLPIERISTPLQSVSYTHLTLPTNREV